MLTLSVLMENTAAEKGFACEHGLSFLLESENATILFDTGQSPAFLDNANRMGIDLASVTNIILSHGHYDHTGGLAAALCRIRERKGGAPLPPLTAHPEIMRERRRKPGSPAGDKDLGIPEDGRKALAAWPIALTKEPVWIRDDIVFLGEIPHKYPDMCVFVGETPVPGGYAADTLPDDTAIAYVTPKGLIIVAGCSHSGIVNIIAHAKAVTGVDTVYAVYGGLHCKDMTPETVARVKEALRNEKLAEICAFHCTGDALQGFPGQITLMAGQKHRVT